jgi:hypothetical protein
VTISNGDGGATGVMIAKNRAPFPRAQIGNHTSGAKA